MTTETFDAYWQRLVKATPALADETDTMKIRIAAFKVQLQKAYWLGHESGSAKAIEDAKKKNPLGSLFGGFP